MHTNSTIINLFYLSLERKREVVVLRSILLQPGMVIEPHSHHLLPQTLSLLPKHCLHLQHNCLATNTLVLHVCSSQPDSSTVYYLPSALEPSSRSLSTKRLFGFLFLLGTGSSSVSRFDVSSALLHTFLAFRMLPEGQERKSNSLMSAV